jgi:hypothetical protein
MWEIRGLLFHGRGAEEPAGSETKRCLDGLSETGDSLGVAVLHALHFVVKHVRTYVRLLY